MTSTVDYDKSFDEWNGNMQFEGQFNVKWVYIKDIPSK